jgi:hypothetical protein
MSYLLTAEAGGTVVSKELQETARVSGTRMRVVHQYLQTSRFFDQRSST